MSKSYGTVRALTDVSLTLRSGEVRALLGKNGAGKSTLVNLISGSQQPDAGTISIAGTAVQFHDPSQARAGGIAVVHQELSLVPGLSVAENIMLGRWPVAGGGVIDRRTMDRTAAEALETLGVRLPLWREAGQLPLAQQQLVEIAKALVDRPRVLILDEPTSALHAREVDSLLELVRRLAGQGVAVIYVSHRMSEIPRVADTLTVLRDGREVDTVDATAATGEEVARMISGGADLARLDPASSRSGSSTSSDVVLSVRGLAVPGVLEGVDLDVHRGEVLGIAGLLGSGRTELLEAIYGVRRSTGQIWAQGILIDRPTPRRMLAHKVAMTPEDRGDAGIVPALGTGENMLLSARGRSLQGQLIRPRREGSLVSRTIQRLQIATASSAQPIGTLSGGNQQKAVIGRQLAAEMSVLLLDEPTRGIDVHAKAQVYALMRDLAVDGVASVFVSSELDELTAVCDRVLVLRGGRIAEEVPGDTESERLLALAMKEH